MRSLGRRGALAFRRLRLLTQSASSSCYLKLLMKLEQRIPPPEAIEMSDHQPHRVKGKPERDWIDSNLSNQVDPQVK